MPTPITFEGLLARVSQSRGLLIPFGDAPCERGWLRIPSGHPPHPVAIIVHGGCWSTVADPHYMDFVAEWVAEMGWATWTVVFPRLGEEGTDGASVFSGVARAADQLREVGSQHQLDLTRVVTLGHSSGGHLALWLGARPRIWANARPEGKADAAQDGLRSGLSTVGRSGKNPLPISAVVTLAGIVDLASFHALAERGCGDRVTELLSGDFSPEHLASTSPAAMLPLGIPQLLISGELDRTVPPAHGVAYAVQGNKAGDPVDHVVIAGAGHFELVAPWTAHFEEVARVIRRFLGELTRPLPSAPESP